MTTGEICAEIFNLFAALEQQIDQRGKLIDSIVGAGQAAASEVSSSKTRTRHD